MTTLAALKSEIADDLTRSDLTAEIAAAITAAIKFYQDERLFFKLNHTSSFATVASQVFYDGDDDADIPLYTDIDQLIIRDSGHDYLLKRVNVLQFEILSDGNTTNNEPSIWMYGNERIGLYPTPDAAYTITILGNYTVAGPASDSETDNDWMTHGYELIRARAISNLMRYKTRQYDEARKFRELELEHLTQLRKRTSRLGSRRRTKPYSYGTRWR
jgi:hypothetical protein